MIERWFLVVTRTKDSFDVREVGEEEMYEGLEEQEIVGSVHFDLEFTYDRKKLITLAALGGIGDYHEVRSAVADYVVTRIR